MKLTFEQEQIIRSEGNIKINAVAGSGKTTTIIEYAATRPKGSRILYLAFNKSVRLDAQRRFAARGLHNVQVETAHSLAYKHIVLRSPYTVRAQGYKTNELAEMLGITGSGEKHAEHIIANHIGKFAAYFCNSDKPKIQDLNYLEVVADANAKKFVESHYRYIERQTRVFLSKMDKAELEITHDFYLKKFQLAEPVLPFDYILFDEGQDASAAMLDVFLKQPATKVIVGDTHQQIYGWRFAVNSLEKTSFTPYSLTTSFRFGKEVAALGMDVLKWKGHIADTPETTIQGLGHTGKIHTKAVIARTNLGLLLQAIEYIQQKNVKKLYFEGNFHSYTYADDGASLYDVLSLYNNHKRKIKDPLIRSMKTMEELEEYIDKTDDVQLGMMVEIVNKYGNQIPGLLKKIKSLHVENDQRDKAEVIFSTVHRCKGMEYDSITLAADFITEDGLKRQLMHTKREELNRDKINEEINLLYVAITRAKSSLSLPDTILSDDLPTNNVVHRYEVNPVTVAVAEEEPKSKHSAYAKREVKKKKSEPAEKAYSVDAIREKHGKAYQPWTPELDQQLTELFCKGAKLKAMSTYFGRTNGAIIARIKKLELYELYG